MTYFVTGATGFLGRNLIGELLEKRKGKIYVLVRSGSKQKFKKLVEEFDGTDRLVAITGDLTKKNLGVAAAKQGELKGKIKHFFHLAAIYDMEHGDDAVQIKTNIDGTRNALNLAEALKAKCFHHTSSIAAAGLYKGHWREDMFDEWEENDHPYYRTKHDSEKLVREEAKIPYRIYRPAMVMGRSDTGAIDKVDGPYYFFKTLKRLRNMMPAWMPLIGIEGGYMNIVPVDYVSQAMDHIAHQPGLDGQAFHLTSDDHPRVGEVLNTFAQAAGAPKFVMRLDASLLGFMPSGLTGMITSLPPIKRIIDSVLDDFGIPRAIFKFANYPTLFDNRDTKRALKGSGIKCPPLNEYAGKLWDYWARNLDEDLYKDRSLNSAVKDKIVLITGASSGIGEATALKVAEAGGHVILAARTPEKLAEVQAKIKAFGGKSSVYAADVADVEGCDKLVASVLKDHGRVDILVNNAGRSIRRSVNLSYDRFHDYERTMQLNYFGALRLIMNVLPSMAAQKSGQIINISSIGVQVNQPRFSAYVASKAALDAFSRCAQPEYLDRNVKFTAVYMPLVRTPMIAPTKMYDHVPTLSPEEAADMVCTAMRTKPKRVSTRLGTFAQLVWAATPNVMDVIFNTSYRLFPDSAAAKGDKTGEEAPSTEAVAFAALTKGVHW